MANQDANVIKLVGGATETAVDLASRMIVKQLAQCPFEGVLVFKDSASSYTTYPDSDEVIALIGAFGGINDAPVDGTKYVRKDGAWVSETVETSSVVIPITNASGGAFSIGQVVYPSGATGAELANAHFREKSQLIAVVSEPIAEGAFGDLVAFGEVVGFDTSSFTAGQIVYLSDTVDGALTGTQPVDGSYTCVVGVIGVVSATVGSIFVDRHISDLTAEVTDTNGFSPTEKAQTTLSATDNTPPAEGDKRNFTITPTDPQFHFYEIGKKYEITGADSVQFTDQEGEHWFYYLGGVLTHYYEPTLPIKKEIILNYAFVAAIYWDATNKKIIGDIQDERHGISMSPETHLYLHLTRGAQFVEGYGIGDLVVNGNGALDTHAQYSVSAGMYFDEDINHIYAGQSVPATMPVLYNLGASATIREGSQDGFGVLNAPAGRLYYNQDVGGNWQLTEVANGDYVLYHIFGFNGQIVNCVAVMGQNDYINLTTARAGANQEISNLVSQLPFPEMIPVGTIIYRTGDAGGTNYSNAVKAIIVSSDAGDYVDWRTTELAQGTAPTSHANLTNVEEAGAGVSQGHINDQAQTIAGVKTFSNGVILPTETTTNITPAIAGWTLNAGSELRVTKKGGIYYINGIMTGSSSSITAGLLIGNLGATITGLRFSQVFASAFNGTSYVAGSAQVGTGGSINWGASTVGTCTTIRINGILDVVE